MEIRKSMQTAMSSAWTQRILLGNRVSRTSERTNMPIYKGIKARLGYSKVSHHDFWTLLMRVYGALLNNIYFPRPPLDLGEFKSKIDEYSAAITDTMGRATIAFANRNSLRRELEKDLFQLSA